MAVIVPNWQNCSDNTNANVVTSFVVGSTHPASSNGSIASGDWLLACIIVSTSSADPGSCAASMVTNGFTTAVDTFDTNQTARVYIGYKVAGGSESGTYTATWSGTPIGASWTLSDFGNVNAVDVSAFVSTSYDSGLYPAPSVSPVGTADMLVCGWLVPGGSGTCSVASGMTQLTNINSTSSDRPEIMVAYQQLSASGATGVRNASTTSNTPSTGFSIALKPNSGGAVAQTPMLMLMGVG